MSPPRLHAVPSRLATLTRSVLVGLALVLAACATPQKPQMRVLGIEQGGRGAGPGRQVKLFVEVTNNAERPMRLQRLQYAFGPAADRRASASVARGEVALSRTVDPGAAIVVEVPISVDPHLLDQAGLALRGHVIAEQDQILRSYPVEADVDDPHASISSADRSVPVDPDPHE